jgi:hypothetical protein
MTATLAAPDLDQLVVGSRKVEVTFRVYVGRHRDDVFVDSRDGVIRVSKVVVSDFGDRARLVFTGRVGNFQIRSAAYALYGYPRNRQALPWMVDLARRVGYTGPVGDAGSADEDCEGS